MSYTVKLTSDSENDILEGVIWYEEQKKDLGKEFIDAVEEHFKILIDAPLLYPKTFFDLRRMLMHKFPFAVYFDVVENDIVVFGCLHTKRDVKKLSGRK